MSSSDRAEEEGEPEPDGESDESAQIYRFFWPQNSSFSKYIIQRKA